MIEVKVTVKELETGDRHEVKAYGETKREATNLGLAKAKGLLGTHKLILVDAQETKYEPLA